LTNWLPDNVIFIRLRGLLASLFFKKCGKRLGLGRNITFYNSGQIEIGNDVYIAIGCWFSASNGVIIEDEVLFGPYNVIATSNHTRKNQSFRFGKNCGEKITINKGAWIGANCTLISGSKIGKGSVIGANSVVIGEVPDNCLVAGNPSCIKKYFDE
jgi:acetyltransferase-like isoleucine patch superfamily enzyme